MPSVSSGWRLPGGPSSLDPLSAVPGPGGGAEAVWQNVILEYLTNIFTSSYGRNHGVKRHVETVHHRPAAPLAVAVPAATRRGRWRAMANRRSEALADYEFLSLEVHDKVAVVTLDRPPVNALNIGLYQDINGAFDEITARKSEVNVAILTGAGRAFCGGRDLKVAGSEDPDERAKWVKAGLGAVYHCGVPVIAAVNGAAVGVGCVLSMVCDIIVAAETAFWAMPEIDAGANPSVATILRGLNQFQARRMAFTGRRYQPADLYRMGILDDIVPLEELLATAHGIAEILASKNPGALRAAKWSANEIEILFTDFEQAYRAIESRVSAVNMQSAEAKESVAAFAEKRGPLSGRTY